MFVVQKTGDTFRVFRQAEASVKRAGSARHTRRGKARKKLSPVGRVLCSTPASRWPSLASKTRKKENKTNNSYSASWKKQRNKTGVPSWQGNSIRFEFLFYAHCTVFGLTVHVCLFLNLHRHVTKSDSCLTKILRYKTDCFKMQSRFFKLLVKEELRAITEITTESCPGKKLTLVIE